jgi:hypothetical protein
MDPDEAEELLLSELVRGLMIARDDIGDEAPVLPSRRFKKAQFIYGANLQTIIRTRAGTYEKSLIFSAADIIERFPAEVVNDADGPAVVSSSSPEDYAPAAILDSSEAATPLMRTAIAEANGACHLSGEVSQAAQTGGRARPKLDPALAALRELASSGNSLINVDRKTLSRMVKKLCEEKSQPFPGERTLRTAIREFRQKP